MPRILVIDDYQDAAESLAMILELHGYQVDVAKDGPAGLKAADANWPEAVLLDIGLPQMDGIEVAQHILSKSIQRRRPLLIAVTGYGDEPHKRRCMAAGFDHHLLKPTDPSELLKILEESNPPLDDLPKAS